MGQSINVLLYGCRVPSGVHLETMIEKWEDHVRDRMAAFEAKLRAKATPSSWGKALDAFVPSTPNPDDAEPDNLIGLLASTVAGATTITPKAMSSQP